MIDPYGTYDDLCDHRAALQEKLGAPGGVMAPILVDVIDTTCTTRRNIVMMPSDIRPHNTYTPEEVVQFDNFNRYAIGTGVFGNLSIEERVATELQIVALDRRINGMVRAKQAAAEFERAAFIEAEKAKATANAQAKAQEQERQRIADLEEKHKKSLAMRAKAKAKRDLAKAEAQALTMAAMEMAGVVVPDDRPAFFSPWQIVKATFGLQQRTSP